MKSGVIYTSNMEGMNPTFNGQILVDKLAKLNCTQQSIETLSHWCIFHRKNAKQVVETWEQQYHCSPTEQRVAFLYLANDILQNSKRKGLEFINEFFRALPGALSDVHNNGGEFGRTTVSRLIGIWEERKVFGSHLHVLKDVMLGKKSDNQRHGKAISYKLKQSTGELMERVIASYHHICDLHVDEDALLENCQAAISYMEKAERELRNDGQSGGTNDPQVSAELQVQHGVLRQSMEQLKVVESSRAILASILKEALSEQEIKVAQLKQKIQLAQSLYQQTENIFPQLKIGQMPSEQGPPGFAYESTWNSGDRELSPIKYSHDGTLINNKHAHPAEGNKPAAETLAANLTASSGSAEYQLMKTANEEYQPDNKKHKVENNSSFLPPPQLQPPLPPFPHPDSLEQPPPPPSPPVDPPSPPMQPPPPPPLPPTVPPTPPPPPPSTAQYTPVFPGHIYGMPYNYGVPVPLPNYPMVGMPPMYPGALNPYHNFQQPNTNNNYVFGQQPPLQPPSAHPPLTRQ